MRALLQITGGKDEPKVNHDDIFLKSTIHCLTIIIYTIP